MANAPTSSNANTIHNTPSGSLLSFRNLSYQVKTKSKENSDSVKMKTLVDNVSVDVTAGEILAIMVSNVVISKEFAFDPFEPGSFWSR